MYNVKILVVDDDVVNRMLMGKILDIQGYAYQLVGSATEAFEALSDKSFSLILMDIEMPDIDGLEATRFIRHLAYFKKLPIIALTAHKREDVLTKALDAGMNEVLSKPFEIDDLLSTISLATTLSTTDDVEI